MRFSSNRVVTGCPWPCAKVDIKPSKAIWTLDQVATSKCMIAQAAQKNSKTLHLRKARTSTGAEHAALHEAWVFSWQL